MIKSLFLFIVAGVFVRAFVFWGGWWGGRLSLQQCMFWCARVYQVHVCVCVCVCVCVWGASMLHLIRGKMGGLLWGLRWAEGVILGEGVLNLVHQIQGELPEKLCGLTMLLAKARRRERA